LGVRDILSALQWVRHNVAAFGGDPSRVTVLGHDTGAALVNLLLISRAAKGKGENKALQQPHCSRCLALLLANLETLSSNLCPEDRLSRLRRFVIFVSHLLQFIIHRMTYHSTLHSETIFK
jgi:hypothetical protein